MFVGCRPSCGLCYVVPAVNDRSTNGSITPSLNASIRYHIPECTGEQIPNSDGFIFELQLHTPQSFEMKDGPGHLLYEDFRDPAVKKGYVCGELIDGTTDPAELKRFKHQLYFVNKKLFLSKNEKGEPLNEGDVVWPGLKTTLHHKWTDQDYT